MNATDTSALLARAYDYLIGIGPSAYERAVSAAAAALVVASVGLLLPQSAAAAVLSSDRVNGVRPSELDLPAAAMPDVTMKAGALVAEDGRVLWTRRVDDRRAMASLTKIMTAVVFLESTEAGEKVVIPEGSVRVGESTAFLREGERLSREDLLEALLVKSGNDAAVAIAQHVAGGEREFAALMNKKAQELGLTDTRFSNPHGLDSKSHYSSATDLAVLARYAMTKPEFRRVVAKKRAVIGEGSRSERVENTNLLLGNYDGANGLKTGWTSDAGYCVIVSAQRQGNELYAVVLGTGSELSRFRDARELLDFGFSHYRPQKLASKGTVIGQAPVTEYLDVSVPAMVAEDSTVTVFDVAGPVTRSVSMAAVEAPVKRGQKVGVATFTQRGEVIGTVPLVAVEAVDDPSVLQRVGIAIVRAWRRLSGVSTEVGWAPARGEVS